MRLAEDERGRVPFALVGVLLVLGAVGVATVQLDASRVNQNAALAGDRTEAAAESTLRAAVRDAGARGAANPVATPAETPYGEVLNASRSYRSYLELLIATELRERLDGTPQRVGNASAVVDLPPIEDPDSARAAVANVHVGTVGTGLVEVRVDDVPIAIRQDGTVVDRRARSLSVTVATPTLTLHDRTAEFQSRLEGDGLESGSLRRGITGGLYGLGWTRGYGQYAGLPIDNVIDVEHAELVTNLALLDAQRAVFGTSDARGEAALARETRHAVQDEVVGAIAGGFSDAALPTNASGSMQDAVDPPEAKTTTVGVNHTADAALADVIEPFEERWNPVGSGPGPRVHPIHDPRAPAKGVPRWAAPLETIVVATSAIDARVATDRRSSDRTLVNREAPPDTDGWERYVEGTTRRILAVDAGDAPRLSPPDPWRVTNVRNRTVVFEETDDVRYVHEDDGTVYEGEDRYRREVDVAVGIAYRPGPSPVVPDRPLEVSEEDDLLGTLLDDADGQLVDDVGGPDELAKRVAAGEKPSRTLTVEPDPEAVDVDAVYGTLIPIRDELRRIDTTTPVTSVLTDDDPIADLVSSVERRESRLRAVPSSYDSLEHRSATAARGIYTDRVLDRLEGRASNAGEVDGVLEDEVEDVSPDSAPGLDAFLDVGMDYARPDPATIETTPPAPELELTVDASPPYLGTEEVQETDAPVPGGEDGAYHPLGVRITTIASLPTEKLTKEIAGLVFGFFDDPTEAVPLPQAARSLRSADSVSADEVNDSDFPDDRRSLRAEVAAGVDVLNRSAADAVASETSLDERASERVVSSALSRWDGPVERTLAYDDGQAADAIVEEAADRPGVRAVRADRAGTVVRDAVAEDLSDDDTHVKLGTVEDATGPARAVLEERIQNGIDDSVNATADRIRGELDGSFVFPTRGFAVAPFPTWWYATVNVWHVDLHGTYASFAVRADQGGPAGGGHVSYVRDGGPVVLDVDGDGRPETLGSADRVSFRTSTTVGVVVPRGRGGIGNNDSDYRERTDGFEPPGPVCPNPPLSTGVEGSLPNGSECGTWGL